MVVGPGWSQCSEEKSSGWVYCLLKVELGGFVGYGEWGKDTVKDDSKLTGQAAGSVKPPICQEGL